MFALAERIPIENKRKYRRRQGEKLFLIECRPFSGTPCTYSGGLLQVAKLLRDESSRRVLRGVCSTSSINTRVRFSIHRCLMYSIRLCAERFDSMREREREREKKRKKKIVIYKRDRRSDFPCRVEYTAKRGNNESI